MATETKQRIVNGVDVRALKETIMAVSEDSDLAQFEFRAHNRRRFAAASPSAPG